MAAISTITTTITSGNGTVNFTNNTFSIYATTMYPETLDSHSPVKLDAHSVAEIIVYNIIFVVCLFGNILLISAILKFQKLWTEVNLLIMNLAFCDILIAVMSIPFTVASFTSRTYLYGPFGCKIISPLATYGNNASVFTLVLIAIERYMAITHFFPLKKRRIVIGILVVHASAICTVIPYLLQLTHEYHNGVAYCYERWYGKPSQKTYTIFLFLFQYCIPLPTMIILYSTAWWRIKQQNKRTILLSEDYESKIEDTTRSDCSSELSVLKETSLLDIVDALNDPQKFSPRLIYYRQTLTSPKNGKKLNYNGLIINESYSSPNLLNQNNNGTYSSSSLPTFTNNNSTKQAVFKRTATLDKLKTFGRKISTFHRPDYKSQVSLARHRQTIRTLKMFIAIVTVFAVFALPNQIVWILRDFSGPKEQPSRTVAFFFLTLTYANSMVNCWIYGGFSVQFRKAYKQIFIKTFKCCTHRMFYRKEKDKQKFFQQSFDKQEEFHRNRRNIFSDIFNQKPIGSTSTSTASKTKETVLELNELTDI